MDRFRKIAGYVALGVATFFFFIYLIFPYGILKEALTLKASELSGYNIAVGELKIRFPLGIELSNIDVSSQKAEKLELTKVSADISLLSLLIGNLTTSLYVLDKKGGTVQTKISFGLFSFLFQNNALPHYAFVKAVDFGVGPVLGFLLAVARDSDAVSPLAKPLFESMKIGAKLNAAIEMDINSTHFQKSEGKLLINLKELNLHSLTENIPIPDQQFSKALITTELKGGIMQVDKNSGFTSNDLNLAISGQITQKPEFTNSLIDLKLDLEVGKALQEHLGFILDAIAQKETSGKMQIKIHGTLSPAPSVSFQ